jgi:hypothetical protein
MFARTLYLDAGPATLVPLLYVPLLHQAPQQDGEYKAVIDSLGDVCHFHGDFSGFHLYFITSAYKVSIKQDSIDYYDKKNGKFSITLQVTLDNGITESINTFDCTAPIGEKTLYGIKYPDFISVEQFSPGRPDALKFHFKHVEPKFKFSHNMIPSLPDNIRFSGLFNLYVEYIGKAVGKDGAREIADRLGNGHSTESLILNELVHKRTNREAFAVLYKPGRLTLSDGTPDPSFSFEEIVEVLEKSLIGEFRPIKNTQSKNFPRDGSKTAHSFIQRNVNRFLIDLNSPEDYGMLFTEDAPAEQHHKFDIKLTDFI